MKFALLPACTALVAAVATTASAGGYIAPAVEPVLAPVMDVAAPSNWQGAYAGVGLGYAFGGDDDFGLDDGVGPVPSLGTLELNGLNGSLHVGYRWQRNRLVVGPELSILGGNIEDSIDIDGAFDVESKVNQVVSLKLKTGYEVQPNMLVFGTAGVARGDFTYTAGDLETDYNANGFVFGLGVERMMNERMSVVAEIERNQFDKESIDLGGGLTTNASPSFNNVKVGVNFKF